MIPILMTMTILVGTTPKADEAQCRDVLHKCDTALNAQLEVNKKLNLIIQDQEKVINLQDEQLKEQSIWKPIAIGAGIVVGVETLILILRK